MRDSIPALDPEITALDTTLARQETEMNNLVYRLYDLSPKENALVEAG